MEKMHAKITASAETEIRFFCMQSITDMYLDTDSQQQPSWRQV